MTGSHMDMKGRPKHCPEIAKSRILLGLDSDDKSNNCIGAKCPWWLNCEIRDKDVAISKTFIH